MSKIKFYIFVFFFLISQNVFSQTIPIPFGIELGKTFNFSLAIGEFNFDNKYKVKPPIRNGNFNEYIVSVVNNKVSSVSAKGKPSDCYVLSKSLAEKISTKYGKMDSYGGGIYILSTKNYNIKINCTFIGSASEITIKYSYKPLLDSSGL